MGADWSFDVTGANGGSVLASDLPWRRAKLTWTAEGPGAIEIDLREADISNDWVPGTHRIIAKRNGTPLDYGAFYITHLSQSGRPGDIQYHVAGLGLKHILDWRTVHDPFSHRGPAWEIVELLLEESQEQSGGDMGLNFGTVTGSFPGERERSYCIGENTGEAIRELAQLANGFDWDIDRTGDLNIWKPNRGVDTALTLAIENTQEWGVEFDVSDLVTQVTAIGENSNPFGPKIKRAQTALGSVYGKHEFVVDVDTDNPERLSNAAERELSSRAGARCIVTAQWIEGKDENPWAFGDVWLFDEVTVDLPSWFGNDQAMRCTEISVDLPPGNNEFIQQVFDTLVEDITESDDEEVS